MQDKSLSVSGLATYWSLGDGTDLEKLKAAWEDVGFDDMIPEQRDGLEVLREALDSLYPVSIKKGEMKHLIRQVKRTGAGPGLAVVLEDRTDPTGNTYSTVLTARLNGTVEAGPETAVVQAAYTAAQQRLPAGAVASALIRAARKLKGITLRDTGGIYWIPAAVIPTWRKLAEAVEEARAGNRVYALTTGTDDETLGAVRAGLTDEVNAEVADALEALGSGKLGKRGVEGKRRLADKLMVKVKSYEAVLGQSLQDVRAALASIETAAATAELVLVASEE